MLTRDSSTTLELFASEYHEMKAMGGNGSHKVLSLVGVAPWPQFPTREENPKVVYWVLDDIKASGSQDKGETDATADTIATKNKPGRPPKKTNEDKNDEDLGIVGDMHKHLYLEKEDGTPISVLELRAMSQKARSYWALLLEYDQAPKTWGKITSIAWEYYARSMLNEPGLEYLRLCKDGQWKLHRWTHLNYSGWAKRHGVREGCAKQTQGGSEQAQTLEDQDLIRMEPRDSEIPEDVEFDITRNDAEPRDGASDLGTSVASRASSREVPRPRVRIHLSRLPLPICLTHTIGPV